MRKADFERVVKDTEWEGLPQSGEPMDCELPKGAKICAKGLVLPNALNFEQWKEVGAALGKIVTAKQWALGDWWAYGHHHKYGKRAEAVAKKLIPYSFGYLMNLGSVARRVTTSCRHEGVSFSHHEVIANAKLKPEAQKEWLAKAAKGKWSADKLHKLIHDSRERLQDVESPDHPDRQSERWVNNLLRQAKRAVPLSDLPKDFDISDISDDRLAELIKGTSEPAEAWSELTKGFESHRDKRTKRASLEAASGVPAIAAKEPEKEPEPQKERRARMRAMN
jgi:hypothetical protein